VDTKAALNEFLVSRRAKITPEQAGLSVYARNRRVAGLRREEVAALTGISVEYYTRLERGNVGGVSEDVLEAIARALQLDEAERNHLFDLVRATSPTQRPKRRPSQERVRPTVQRLLDAMVDLPAYIRNGRLDVLYANRLGDALYAPLESNDGRPRNVARFVFLNPNATEFFSDWDGIADDAVAILRLEAGRNPNDRRLTDLIGELSTRSDAFLVRWAAHNVKLHRTGVKRIYHPLVGEITLAYEGLELPGDPGQMILVYSAEPASPSEQALNLLGSWTAAPAELSAHQQPTDDDSDRLT
jgi:transcriptional regulator with XRE-family HTH domain